jgi:hypothetical protein
MKTVSLITVVDHANFGNVIRKVLVENKLDAGRVGMVLREEARTRCREQMVKEGERMQSFIDDCADAIVYQTLELDLYDPLDAARMLSEFNDHTDRKD